MWMNAFPFGIMNLLKSTLGIETRIISEVGLVTIDLGGDLAGEIRPPTHTVSLDTTINGTVLRLVSIYPCKCRMGCVMKSPTPVL